jgi:hypothetical protein
MEKQDQMDTISAPKSTGLTREQVERLDALAAKATPGPWIPGQKGNLRIYGPDCRGGHSGLVAQVYKGRDSLDLIVALVNVEIDEIDTGIIAICCPECRTIGPHQDGAQTTEEAIEKWNRRGTVAA